MTPAERHYQNMKKAQKKYYNKKMNEKGPRRPVGRPRKVVVWLRELYSNQEKQLEFINKEGLDDTPGIHICWMALEQTLRTLMTSDEIDELGGCQEHEHETIMPRLATKYGLPIPGGR